MDDYEPVLSFGEEVAAHLTDDGSFVVEAGVPGWLYRLERNQHVDAEAIGVDQVRLDVAHFDPVTQRLEESHVRLTRGGVRLYPIVTRYSWSSELDLMARIAGLRPKERWDGWQREPFTSTGNCVSGAASFRQHVISRPLVLRWMRRSFAAAFVALGAKLALAER